MLLFVIFLQKRGIKVLYIISLVLKSIINDLTNKLSIKLITKNVAGINNKSAIINLVFIKRTPKNRKKEIAIRCPNRFNNEGDSLIIILSLYFNILKSKLYRNHFIFNF